MIQPPGTFLQAPPWPRREVALVALGTALLAAAVTTAALWARWEDGDLDVVVLLLGVAATLGLLAAAFVAARKVGDPERRAHLVAWPGAAGAVGSGAMLGVGIDDMEGLGYLVGAVILALSVIGHLAVPRPPFVLSGIVGLGAVYLELVGDIFDAMFDSDQVGDNLGMFLAIALVVFTVAITMAARIFVPSGDFAGLVVGAGAVVLSVVIAAVIGVYAAISSAFAGLGAWDEESGDVSPSSDAPYDNDLWVLLVCGVVLVAFWSWLAWSGGAPGYRVLALAQAAVLVPVVTVALGTEQPGVWVAVLLVGGAVATGGALASALGFGSPPSPPASAGDQPIAPGDHRR